MTSTNAELAERLRSLAGCRTTRMETREFILEAAARLDQAEKLRDAVLTASRDIECERVRMKPECGDYPCGYRDGLSYGTNKLLAALKDAFPELATPAAPSREE